MPREQMAVKEDSILPASGSRLCHAFRLGEARRARIFRAGVESDHSDSVDRTRLGLSRPCLPLCLELQAALPEAVTGK